MESCRRRYRPVDDCDPDRAGKTTTIRLLLGLHRPTGGSAELFGMDCWTDPVRAHRRVAYVAGEPFLWPSMTAEETLEFLARLHRGVDRAYRKVLIDRFELVASKKVRALSKGNRQKVQLVAALATPADLLVLDEPTRVLADRCCASRGKRRNDSRHCSRCRSVAANGSPAGWRSPSPAPR